MLKTEEMQLSHTGRYDKTVLQDLRIVIFVSTCLQSKSKTFFVIQNNFRGKGFEGKGSLTKVRDRISVGRTKGIGLMWVKDRIEVGKIVLLLHRKQNKELYLY